MVHEEVHLFPALKNDEDGEGDWAMVQVVTSTDASIVLLANYPNSIPPGASRYYYLVLPINKRNRKVRI